MTSPAAIQGQLVSIKNVSTHKSACLTIHVPEEQALQAIEAFGWPTMVNPVPVALARINPDAKPERRGGKLAQRAGILCNEKAFWKWLDDEFSGLQTFTTDSETAAARIREHCNIASRADLDHNVEAARKFNAMEMEYKAWLKVA